MEPSKLWMRSYSRQAQVWLKCTDIQIGLSRMILIGIVYLFGSSRWCHHIICLARSEVVKLLHRVQSPKQDVEPYPINGALPSGRYEPVGN